MFKDFRKPLFSDQIANSPEHFCFYKMVRFKGTVTWYTLRERERVNQQALRLTVKMVREKRGQAICTLCPVVC